MLLIVRYQGNFIRFEIDKVNNYIKQVKSNIIFHEWLKLNCYLIRITKLRSCWPWSIVNFNCFSKKLLLPQSWLQILLDFSKILIFLQSFIKRDKYLKTIFRALYHVCVKVSFYIKLKAMFSLILCIVLLTQFVNFLLKRHHVGIDQSELISCSFLSFTEKRGYFNTASVTASVCFELFKRVLSLSFDLFLLFLHFSWNSLFWILWLLWICWTWWRYYRLWISFFSFNWRVIFQTLLTRFYSS